MADPKNLLEEQKANCLFCKIILGEVPSKKIYEDEDFIAILDINPASEGHTLLLPKEHFQIMPQIPEQLMAKLGVVIKNLTAILMKIFSLKGINVFIANGFVAGQKAPHFMVHLIPRTESDSLKLNLENPQKLTDDEILELRSKFLGQELAKQDFKSNNFASPEKTSNAEQDVKKENSKENSKEDNKITSKETSANDQNNHSDNSPNKSPNNNLDNNSNRDTTPNLDKISGLFQ